MATPAPLFALSFVLAASVSLAADGPVEITSEVTPPQLVTRVEPLYPEAARAAGQEGTVVLRCIVDTEGAVKVVEILKSVSADLDLAASLAMSHWKYTPAVMGGEKIAVYLAVRINFELDSAEGQARQADVLKVTGDITPPHRVAGQPPAYPVEARKAKVEGKVVLECIIDTKGSVSVNRVLKGLAPDLDEAAIASVTQWRYEPALKDGMPVAVYLTVKVQFKLR